MVDFNKSCRLCLLEVQNHFNIFDGLNSLPSRIMTLANVEITEGDGLPTLICLTCYAKIEQYHDFKSQVEKSDAVLRDQLTNNNGSEDVNNGPKRSTAAASVLTPERRSLRVKMQTALKDVESVSSSSPAGSYNRLSQVHVEKIQLNGEDYEEESNYDSAVENQALFGDSDEDENKDDIPLDGSYIDEVQEVSYSKKRRKRSSNQSSDCTYDCDQCEKQFKARSALEVHLRVHSGEKPFECDICHKKFSQAGNLYEHKMCHEKIKRFPCELCGKRFIFARRLRLHIQTVHGGERPHTCPYCNKAFSSSTYMRLHMKIHTGEEIVRYACDMCDKSYTQNSGLQKHKQTVHRKRRTKLKNYLKTDEISSSTDNYENELNKDVPQETELEDVKETIELKQEVPTSDLAEEFAELCKEDFVKCEYEEVVGFDEDGEPRFANREPVFCEVCGKSFRNKCNLLVHLRVHTGEKPFICDQCPKSFSQAGGLYEHKFVHAGEKPYECKTCGKFFVSMRRVKVHQKSHAPGRTSYPCSLCHQSFVSKSYLKTHIRVHTGEAICYQCEVCGKSYTQSNSLKKHKEKVHEGKVFEVKKERSCEFCGKLFATASALTVHSRIHTGEKPFECEICKKCFAQKAGLLEHQISHTRLKPYVCDICGRAYSFARKLRDHQLVHGGERLFPCSICNRKFYLKAVLKMHMRVHTGIKPYNCDICEQSFAQKGTLNKHRLTHLDSSERPTATCEICKKEVKESRLSAHIREHIRGKKFECDICGRAFSTLSRLTDHKLNHAGLKPHICGICGSKFTLERKLRYHVKARHPDEMNMVYCEEDNLVILE